jgi:hypothetical protein
MIQFVMVKKIKMFSVSADIQISKQELKLLHFSFTSITPLGEYIWEPAVHIKYIPQLKPATLYSCAKVEANPFKSPNTIFYKLFARKGLAWSFKNWNGAAGVEAGVYIKFTKEISQQQLETKVVWIYIE